MIGPLDNKLDTNDPCNPTKFHFDILSEHDNDCEGSPLPGLVLTAPNV